MLSFADIELNLKLLDGSYNDSALGSPKKAHFYSKLAVLELCGWIETMMDEMIEDTCNKMTSDTDIRTKVSKFQKRINGFHYDDHFSRMLIHLLGIVGYKDIEYKVDAGKLAILKSNLNTLKELRNHCAHTYTHGTLKTINTPSITLSLLKPLFDGLKEFENELAKI